MHLFRKTDPLALPVSMAGVKLGNRVLFVGCSDPKLIAAIAVKTGLTGRALAVDEQEDRATSAAAVAQREGALIESTTAPWTSLPLESESFDVAIVRNVLLELTPERRAGCISEIRRALRNGGRCLIIEPATRAGLGALLSRRSADQYYVASGGAVPALQAEGFRGVRVIAEREGLTFSEGVKPNPATSVAAGAAALATGGRADELGDIGLQRLVC